MKKSHGNHFERRALSTSTRCEFYNFHLNKILLYRKLPSTLLNISVTIHFSWSNLSEKFWPQKLVKQGILFELNYYKQLQCLRNCYPLQRKRKRLLYTFKKKEPTLSKKKFLILPTWTILLRVSSARPVFASRPSIITEIKFQIAKIIIKLWLNFH